MLGDYKVRNGYFDNILDKFVKNVEDFKTNAIIGNEDLKRHSESNIHSWLQYLMIRSGEQSGSLAIPEIKLRLTKPIYPTDYGLKQEKRRGRHFNKVDIAFFDYRKTLLGLSEIFTMDEAHGALPSRELAKVGHYWLTPRDSLLHLTQHSLLKLNFIILVVILVKRAPYIAWKTGIKEIDSELESSRNYYQIFKPYWKQFKDKIKIGNGLLIISEDGTERW